MLQFLVEQCTATDEETQFAAKTLTNFVEEDFVEEFHNRQQGSTRATVIQTALSIISLASALAQFKQSLRNRSLTADVLLNGFFETLGQSRHREKEVWAHLADVVRNVFECFAGSSPHLHGGCRGTLHHHHIEAHDVRKAMVERQDDEGAPSVVDGHTAEALLHIGGIVAVGQAHALGVGGCAGSVGDGGYCVVGERTSHSEKTLHALLFHKLSTSRHQVAHKDFAFFVVGLGIEHNDVAQKGQLMANFTHLFQLQTAYHHFVHIAMGEAKEEIVALFEFDTERHIDRTGIKHGQFAHNPEVAPLAQQGKVVAGLYAKDLQTRPQGIDLVADVGIA